MTLQSYCIRPDNNYLKRERSIDQSQIQGKPYTFFQLRQLDVTGRDLYEWSAPIDTIEQYQFYLIDSSSIENGIYYNCSSPFWFGSFCQYTLNSSDTLTEILHERFSSRIHPYTPKEFADIWSATNGTCYIHLKCNRGPSPICLDWREICDRKCDCLNDCIDEDNCFQLETNECREDQYRCDNGMCISQDLLLDRNEFLDCMDGSDESIIGYDRSECLGNPDFDCDTLTCSWFNSFSCGNGQCLREYSSSFFGMSNCQNGRDRLQTRVILMYEASSELSERCWLAIICALHLDVNIFDIDCNGDQSIQFDCPSIFFFPSTLASFNHFRFVYEQNEMNRFKASYICFEAKGCEKSLQASVFINETACKPIDEFPLDITDWSDSFLRLYRRVVSHFKQLCSSLPEYVLTTDGNCSDSSLFHCQGSSKCISKYLVQDGNIDCYRSYDELVNESCSLNLSHRYYCSSNRKCIPQVQLRDPMIDCFVQIEEFFSNRDCFLYQKCDKQNLIFSKICDSFTEMLPILIDNQNETDETNCQYWPCDTPYTHCDQVWNCANGADEVNCPDAIYPFSCQDNEHHCGQLNNTKREWKFGEPVFYTCLPMKLAGNQQVDCLGSTDERGYCRLNYPHEPNRRYRCWNDTLCIDVKHLCDWSYDCPLGDDEKICSWIDHTEDMYYDDYFICDRDEYLSRQLLCVFERCSQKTDALICDLTELNKPERKYFFIGNYSLPYPDIPRRHYESSSIETKPLSTKQENAKSNDLLLQWYCNQGVLVYSFDQNMYCFCPAAYYGDRCQYQNEFLALILNIRRISPRDYVYVFRIIIVLLDDKRNSYIYFILINRNYSVHLDIYSIHRLSNTIRFRTSFYYTIPFSFLPVNRLLINLPIPEQQAQSKSCESMTCQNGKCYQYENTNQHYCQCDPDWFGTFCHLPRQCNCSSQSICVGTDCICPLGKSGSLCYVSEMIPCQEIICQHGGTCIPGDQRILEKDSPCICSEEYEGLFCEKRRIHILIHFDNNIKIPGAIFIHYFITRKSRKPDRLMQFKRIPVYETHVILYPSMQYNMAFAQFDNNYYLIFIDSIPSRQNLSTTVILSNKCSSIEELFDRTTFLYHPLKRIKYYHLICQHNHHLQCFYDETQLCLCTKDHLANCFDFNHNEISSCNATNYCENNGKCYINDLTCPTKSICVCEQCYYGTLCQFTTTGSIISLDSIIGYHIQPNVLFRQQSFIIQLTTGITIGMLVLGSIANLLSIITFSRKKVREIGCGIYLLSSSILSFLTMIIFAYKFCSLLAIQMSWITNELFLILNCRIVDFLLRFLPVTVEWLSACVAIERALNIILGVNFNRRKSQVWAKFIVVIVILVNIGSALHDPFNRQLLEDTEEQRIWCIVSYTHSSWLNIYNKTWNIIHFLLPFSINFISAFVIIVIAARHRSVLRKNQTYRQQLREQFQHHKHLLISSTILVILALPRLFISFLSGCMKSVRDPWLFLTAYFISFIPIILIFPIFVLPSETYKMELIFSLTDYRTRIRRYFCTT